MSRCRSCGAEIIWTVTEKGKRMPVDAAPVENGNLMLTRTAPEEPLTAKKWRPSLFDDDESLRYVSHFVTCPQGESWRKKR